MRHERGASPLVLSVGFSGNSKQKRHFFYRVARRGTCLPHPSCEGGTILFWRYEAPLWPCYCCGASDPRHLALACPSAVQASFAQCLLQLLRGDRFLPNDALEEFLQGGHASTKLLNVGLQAT